MQGSTRKTWSPRLRAALIAACGLTVGAAFAAPAFAADPAPAAVPVAAADANPPADNDAQLAEAQKDLMATHDQRIAWWRDAHFGMFIHWGVYSVPAGVYHGQESNHIGEWIQLDFRIPSAEYAGYAKQFNPVKFNAEEWVKIAKDAGMKYIVITSKHHDGFAMFHSKTSPYNIYDATPFKRDPIAELAAACKKEGLKFGLYYSQAQDWGHPGGGAALKTYPGRPAQDPQTHHWDTAQDGSFDEYLDTVAIPQVKEILTNYGPICELWFDTPVNMTPARAAKFLPLFKLQPDMLINNRLENKRSFGDFDTPEQKIPATGTPGKDWESCMTMNSTWGYKSFDDKWKSVETLQHNLIDIASKGGNYLLNVGPTSEGVIPAPSIERLKEIGAWMKANSDSFYGSTANPFNPKDAPGWTAPLADKSLVGRVTKKVSGGNTTLYFHVFNWPADGKLSIPAIKNEVVSATLLASKAKVEVGDGVITVPAEAPDKLDTVIAVTVKGEIAAK